MIIEKIKKPYFLVVLWLIFSFIALGYFAYQDTIFGAVCA